MFSKDDCGTETAEPGAEHKGLAAHVGEALLVTGRFLHPGVEGLPRADQQRDVGMSVHSDTQHCQSWKHKF